ncbi:DNA cytosine methyltransferase [Xanthobacter sp.]|uniref:DNA cytosine methyltransferase n=1 Tax=Xanthobacter sp. TaxID=35809 RepID=UPI0025F953F0|nr:DNA cytosine methyltransferase [Xanthobacter sp.]
MLVRELVVDSFAGGGGASTGIRIALGRDPDFGINHDHFALAMYRVNHPGSRCLLQDVATVDSVGMCAGLPIGMLWMSPDCTDHSKAKGAAPRRDGSRTTRGIGWAIVGWVRALPKWQRPRVVFLENVEEYLDWSPLLEDGKRDPSRKGETFEQFVAAWKALGYSKIEWRKIRAWDHGAGTIRLRLYIVMRRDGEEIVWPERTFGNPGDAADAGRIAAGELQPWVTAADNIDFTLPIPSIFDTRAEIKRKLGVNAKRPLAVKTGARIAKGIRRRVLDVPRPFIVKVNHTGRDEPRDREICAPLSAMTGKRDDALVAPVVAYAQQGGGDRAATAPFHTFTASAKDQNAIVVPYLVPRYGERPGQEPRSLACDRPSPTPVPTGNEGSLVAAFMAQHNAGPRPGAPSHAVERPLSTTTTTGSQQTLVAAHMLTLRGSDRRDADAAEPTRTVSAGGNHNAVVSMPLLAVYYGSDDDGAGADVPMRTDTAKPRFGLVSADAMVPTFGPEHESRAREVAEFLRAHGCWDGGEFVTVEVDGISLVIVDVCMRMLTPRERFNANGFPPDYIIDYGLDENGEVVRLTLEQQGHMCGNAVCPPVAAALVRANYVPRELKLPGPRRAALPSLFAEAAE